MKPNETATIFRPMGEIFLSNTAEPIIFLVSGIGITPIISMLNKLEKTNFTVLFQQNQTIISLFRLSGKLEARQIDTSVYKHRQKD